MFSRIRKEARTSFVALTLIMIGLTVSAGAAPVRSLDDPGLFAKWIGLLERALETLPFFHWAEEVPAKSGSTYDPTGRVESFAQTGHTAAGGDSLWSGSEYDPTGLD